MKSDKTNKAKSITIKWEKDSGEFLRWTKTCIDLGLSFEIKSDTQAYSLKIFTSLTSPIVRAFSLILNGKEEESIEDIFNVTSFEETRLVKIPEGAFTIIPPAIHESILIAVEQLAAARER